MPTLSLPISASEALVHDFTVDPPALPHVPGAAVGVRISGLNKSFGGNTVLRNLDLEVPAGQFVAIVGKSGCGKSTLLRLVAGLEQPTEGSVEFVAADGEPVHPNARILFQEPRLLPWASVVDNVAVGLGEAVGRGEARRLAQAALADVQLGEKSAEWPSRLSGGQRQRAALARALVSRPDFLSMDEPLGALDALTRITMQGLVERVWQEQGFTALFVTHDVGEAVALADRVIVLDEGRVVLDLAVDHPRPRRRGAADLARIEGQLLQRIFN